MTEAEKQKLLLVILERQNEAQTLLLEMLVTGEHNRADIRKASSLLSHNRSEIRKIRHDQQERENENETLPGH